MTWRSTAHISSSPGWKPLLVAKGRVLVPSRGKVVFSGEGGDPDAVARFEVRRGVPVCVGVEVRPSPGGRPLRSSDFAAFRELDAMGRRVFREIALAVEHDLERHESSGVALADLDDDALAWELDGAFMARQSRKRPTPQAELEEVARIYTGAEHAPIEAVRRTRGYSRRTAARRIAEARAAGLMPSNETERS